MTATTDPLADFAPDARAVFAAIADHLIPAAHGMPSASEIVDDERLRFVLRSRPDLAPALAAALRPELDDDPEARLATLERDEPDNLAALQLILVAGYYTDETVRERIGYPGQLAIPVDVSEPPAYLTEGLIDSLIRRGPVWRDPRTGQRADEPTEVPDYSDVFRPGIDRPAGGDHGSDGA